MEEERKAAPRALPIAQQNQKYQKHKRRMERSRFVMADPDWARSVGKVSHAVMLVTIQ